VRGSKQRERRHDPTDPADDRILPLQAGQDRDQRTPALHLGLPLPRLPEDERQRLFAQGEPVPGGLQGATIRHHFCPHCKSWMFTRIEGMDLFVNVRATLLDDTSWYTPFIETWTDERLPWAKTPARHSYPGFPPEADFPRLLAEFAGA
jgi:hypothetical protein